MKTILLIDDEQEYLDLISPRIEKWGYSVASFLEGKKALEYLQSNKPDIMLLDLGLPDISGMKVLLETKTKSPEIVVWVVSAFNDPDLREQAIKLKADDFITKPFLPGDLKVKLQEHFDQRSNLEKEG
jgi:DNA-binding response OmpR family regulator